MICDCCSANLPTGIKQMYPIGDKWIVCSECYFSKTEDALINILREKNPNTPTTLQDEYRAHAGKEAIQSGVINPEYLLWLEATVRNLRNH